MRIASQNSVDVTAQKSVATKSVSTPKVAGFEEVEAKAMTRLEKALEVDEKKSEREIPREKLQQAVDTMNELLDVNKKSSKFILHDGLDRYYVSLVDAETEEVIKEIPPKRLLDAFYEMQKLAGMIVDEKI